MPINLKLLRGPFPANHFQQNSVQKQPLVDGNHATDMEPDPIVRIARLWNLPFGETLYCEELGARFRPIDVVSKNGYETGKGLIVRVDATKCKDCPDFVYYPTLEQVPIFIANQEHLHPGGPSGYFPGSVGVITTRLESGVNTGNKTLHITFMQSCYKSGAGGMTRGFASRYNGWRHRVLAHVFQHANDNSANTVTLTIPYGRRAGKNELVFRQVAEEHGFMVDSRMAQVSKSVFSDYVMISQKDMAIK